MRTCEHARHRYECVSCQFARQDSDRQALRTALEWALMIGGGVLLTLAAAALS